MFNSRTTFDREVKVGASVLTEKGNIYQGSNFEQPSSLFNSMSTGGLSGAPGSFLNNGSPWASAGGGGIGDDRVFIQAEDCAIMKAMIDGNTQIRAVAVHVKHLIPSLNQQCQAM
jgi:cytidine deaminase